MKEQINRYARGAFEYYPLSIQISPEAISTNVENNKPFRGQIRIAEASGRSVKGIVYSSNDRVRLINDQFIGADNYIEFEVDACGLSVGDEITGAFYIVSNGGEEKLGFEFEVLNGFFDSEMGSIKNLFHFANLAQTDIASACDIFSRPDFNDIFLADDLKNQKLHDMLLLGSDIKCAVEEFLVAVNKKQKVTLSLSHTMKVFDDPQDTADTIIISKDTWGCCDITVWTDGDFIKLAAPRITEEAFNGGKLEYNYIIDRQKLHAGLNFASITFKTVYQELKCAVTVNNCLKPALANETAANNFSDSDYKANLDLENKRNLSKLVKTYLNFKLHKININDWITESKESLLALLKARPDDSHYGLVMGQVLITDKDPASARNYLDA